MQYNPEELKEILKIYKAESEEIIQGLNDLFMELEKNPKDKSPITKLLQQAHSLKGASRMLGFNSIQDLSHKLEDILSYWKKDEITINPDNFQLIYKVCDTLNKLVEKSVEQQNDYSDDSILLLINQLSEFSVSCNSETRKQKQPKNNQDYIKQKSMDIKAIMLELLFVSEKENIIEDFEDSMLVITDDLKQLSEIFGKTDNTDINNKISNILNYISQNGSQNLSEIKEKITQLNNDIYNLNKELKITSINTQKKEETEPEKKEEKISEEDKIINDIDDIISDLALAKNNKENIIKIEPKLKDINEKINNNNTDILINKVLKILNIFDNKKIPLNNDCYIVILQSLNYIKEIIKNEKTENLSNLELLLQRLNIIEDMNKIKEAQTKIEAVKGNEILSSENYSNIRKNFDGIDIQEIKTLRVDTEVLDTLISQTGELLINGIKTRDHIIELTKINEKLIRWNSVSKKITNYLKYLEKKGFFNSEKDEGASSFFKRTQNFFINNAEVINEINNNFTNLYNIISEDDNKLHQTAVEIETIAKRLRVLPLATLFHSFPRMIRDIAKENNKKIDFIITGSDTTVDKKIIEEIKMPLIHILRNSVSHGIEKPEDRIKNKKPETGIIKLSAKQYENNVIITVEDDGYGVDIEKIKEIALKKGILTSEEIENTNNEQLMRLLFLPGFSTEESVNDISGRGIGLDIVKTKINNLNGDILIESVLNKGCRVTIRLPLSMSTIKTFVIKINEQKYALPVNAIKYVKQITKKEIFNKNGVNSIIYDEHSIPVYYLSEILGKKSDENTTEENITVIIIEIQDKQKAFIVDKLYGDYEVFQKKLAIPIIKIKNISGYTMLSTGEICLIINPYELVMNADLNKLII